MEITEANRVYNPLPCKRHGKADYDQALNFFRLHHRSYRTYRFGEKPWKQRSPTLSNETEIFESIQNIAREHFEIEQSVEVIAIYTNSLKSEFLFVEVNAEAIPSEIIEPFYFSPNHDFKWPLYVANVTPEEWIKIKSRMIKLPPGWENRPIAVLQRDKVFRT